jgi:hypothetical protein
MSEIESSSGSEMVITPHLHYRFHWKEDHWKQDIVSVGDCQAIPRIWSTEGEIAQGGHSMPASPFYQQLAMEQVSPMVTVSRLEGRSGAHHYSARFTIEERSDGVVVDVEVTAQGAGSTHALVATYLIESSSGLLDRGDAATITWTNPETRLHFEADPPSRVQADEAGMGTIRLKALAPPDPSSEVQSLRYRWTWTTTPGHQIWDREV